MKRPYVITGDRGFVGRHMRRYLLDRGERVIGISRRPPDEAASESYTPLMLDLADAAAVESVRHAFQEAAAVFHMAARLPASDAEPLEAHLRDNLRSTENLLDALAGTQAALIASSTMSVYGLPPARLPVDETIRPRPDNAYGLTKLAAEYAVEQAASGSDERGPCVVLRYPGIFGTGYPYGAIHYYARQALAGGEVPVYGPDEIVRDYVHVEDAVAANRLAAEKASQWSWRLFHIGGGDPRPLTEIATLIVEAAGSGRVQVTDNSGPPSFAFDIRRAQNELGYRPQCLKDRIQQYINALPSLRP